MAERCSDRIKTDRFVNSDTRETANKRSNYEVIDPLALAHNQYIYKGIRYPNYVVKENLEHAERIDIKRGDWIVCGYPKSGTTWLEEVVYLISKAGHIEDISEENTKQRIPAIERQIQTNWDDVYDRKVTPRIFKTHFTPDLLPKLIFEECVKIVYIVRDPRDVAVSYFPFCRDNYNMGNFSGNWGDFYKLFVTNRAPYGSWYDNVKKWLKYKKHPNTFFIAYEDMNNDISGSISKLARFLEKEVDEDGIAAIADLTSFENMKINSCTNQSLFFGSEKDNPFQRKGIVGDWKNYFTESQEKEFTDIYHKEMADADLFQHFQDLFKI